MPNPARTVAIFDLGGVLIDWNPRHLFRKLLPDDEAGMEHFLAHVCNGHWNEQQDAGRSFADGVAELLPKHPGKAHLIRAYHERWVETLGGAIEGTVAVLGELRARGVPLYALTNWSHETFAIAQPMFPFLEWFKGIVVSGRERLIKPDPRIYRVLLERYTVAPETAVYIDDNARNAEAARELGLHGIHFTGSEALRSELEGLGLLSAGVLHEK